MRYHHNDEAISYRELCATAENIVHLGTIRIQISRRRTLMRKFMPRKIVTVSIVTD